MDPCGTPDNSRGMLSHKCHPVKYWNWTDLMTTTVTHNTARDAGDAARAFYRAILAVTRSPDSRLDLGGHFGPAKRTGGRYQEAVIFSLQPPSLSAAALPALHMLAPLVSFLHPPTLHSLVTLHGKRAICSGKIMGHRSVPCGTFCCDFCSELL
ncbi:hypothetical protein J6590_020715 [Homalodisca vitripennis]|nr:hypothetical protein J6590_020715 [Homalodisca vitripennis]